MRLALVIPCFNEEEALPRTLAALSGELDALVCNGLITEDSFVLCVDDGSSDGTWSVIEDAHTSDSRIKGIRLAHNRGQQTAILAGLDAVRTRVDAAISIDADLQDSPSAIAPMASQYAAGADIVYGVRASRKTDTWFKRNSARAFYSLQRKLAPEAVFEHSEFRLLSRRAMELLSTYGERQIYLRGLIPQIGLRTATVSYDRAARTAGTTKYSLSKLIATSIEGITSITTRPIRVIFVLGLLMLAGDIATSLWALAARLCGHTVPGWTSLMLSVWFLCSVIIIAVGIIGEYIGKIFVEVKHRPRYAIADTLL